MTLEDLAVRYLLDLPTNEQIKVYNIVQGDGDYYNACKLFPIFDDYGEIREELIEFISHTSDWSNFGDGYLDSLVSNLVKRSDGVAFIFDDDEPVLLNASDVRDFLKSSMSFFNDGTLSNSEPNQTILFMYLRDKDVESWNPWFELMRQRNGGE